MGTGVNELESFGPVRADEVNGRRGEETVESLALGVIVLTTVAGTLVHLRRTGGRFRLPTATIAVAAVTLVTSVVGNVDPHVLDLFGRDHSLLLKGEWWRLVTPLFVQDGGWLGTLFNISSLIVVGLCAETLHRHATFLVVYFLAGLTSEIVAYTVLPNQGFAGNSVAVMGAAGLCLVTLCVIGEITTKILGVVGVLSGVALLVTANLHGIGFAVGASAGVVAALRSRRTTPSATTRTQS
jgi:membrane associated rhomboid family serine protease